MRTSIYSILLLFLLAGCGAALSPLVNDNLIEDSGLPAPAAERLQSGLVRFAGEDYTLLSIEPAPSPQVAPATLGFEGDVWCVVARPNDTDQQLRLFGAQTAEGWAFSVSANTPDSLFDQLGCQS